MKLHALVEKTQHVVEAKLNATGDKVNRLIQKALWPIVQQLEIKTASGSVVLRRDKDGAVLNQLRAKSLELIDQYSGVNKERHIQIVNGAHTYQEIIKLMTNVMMLNMGQGVIKESIMNEVFLGQTSPFKRVDKPLSVIEYKITNVDGAEINMQVELSDDSIDLGNNSECEFVLMHLTGTASRMGDIEWYADIAQNQHRTNEPNCGQISAEYFARFKQKYPNGDAVLQHIELDDGYFMHEVERRSSARNQDMRDERRIDDYQDRR